MGEDRTRSVGQFTQPFHWQKTPNKPKTTYTNQSQLWTSKSKWKKKTNPKVNLVLCSSYLPRKKIGGSIFVFDGYLLSKAYSRQQLALMHVWVFSATLSPLLSLLTFSSLLVDYLAPSTAQNTPVNSESYCMLIKPKLNWNWEKQTKPIKNMKD